MGEQSNLEDEMSRFEQEILGSDSGRRPNAAATAPAIGANTFTSVQEQLAALRAQVYGSGPSAQQNEPANKTSTGNSGQPAAAPPRMAAPPRPPGFIAPSINGVSDNSSGPRPMSGPPPPPPGLTGGPRPASFLPPQLRARAPGPQAAPGNGQFPNNFQDTRPPMSRPSMMPAQLRPPPGMMPGMPTGMMPMGPQRPQRDSLSSGPVRYSQPPVTQAPKVVYSSKPVIHKPSKNVVSEADKVQTANSLKRDAPEPTPAGPSMSHTDYSVSQSASNASMLDPSQPLSKKEKKNKPMKEKKFVRTAANEVWEDQSLADWDPNDFRVFCGDLGNEVTDEKLAEAFKKYPSLQRAKVIRDRRTHKTKGYGFISFKDPTDYTRAMREMNGKYVGNRPIKLRKSNWKDRNVEVVKKKEREKKKLGFR